MTEGTLKKLRKKFILLSMGSLIVSMFLIAGMLYLGSSLINHQAVRNTLNYIVQMNGILEPQEQEEDYGSDPTDFEASDETDTYSDNPIRILQDIFFTNEKDTPEFAYTTRYFVIFFNSMDEITDVMTSHISAISEEEANVYGQLALSRKNTYGRYDEYYYQVSYEEDGSGLVVYLDGSSVQRSNARMLNLALILIGFGIIVSCFVSRRFAGWAVKGEIRNGEIQKRFMTDISHELKTPLAVIRANTEMEELLNGETEWTESTLRQVERMNGLIQNLVTIARAEERSSEVIMEQIPVTELVADTVNNFQSLAIRTKKTLQTDLEDGVTMLGEEGQIRQLTSLLVDNAMKYCDEEGRVDVSLKKKGRTVILVVSNSYAEGKDVDYTRFFERFYREDSSHNIDKGGYGIGLSVAESIVRRYKGTISASWEHGIISFTCLLR